MRAFIWITLATLRVFFLKASGLTWLWPHLQYVHQGGIHLLERNTSRYTWLYESLLVGGNLENRDAPVVNALISLGLYHLTVASGRQISLLENTTAFVTDTVFARAQFYATFILLFSFTLVSGLRPACVWAFTFWFLRCRAKNAPSIRADHLLIASCICVMIEPSWASKLSFHLTCAGHLAIEIVHELALRRPLIRAVWASMSCVTLTAPLLFSIQPCLSWLVIPANVIGYPLFIFLILPLCCIAAFFRPITVYAEKALTAIFDGATWAAQFAEPRFCLTQRSMKAWGLFYVAGLYFTWRLALPFYRRKKFWKSQFEIAQK